MALWGRLSVAGGKPVVDPDKPHRRLGKLDAHPHDNFLCGEAKTQSGRVSRAANLA